MPSVLDRYGRPVVGGPMIALYGRPGQVIARSGPSRLIARPLMPHNGDQNHERPLRAILGRPPLAVTMGRAQARVAVISRTCAYRARTAGVGSASWTCVPAASHPGGSAPPSSTHAAWRAAPSAT